MKKCYNCCNYYKEGCFCGYSASMCKIYGSLDMDQTKRHPDTAAETCPMYNIIQIPTKDKPIKIATLEAFEPFQDF